MMQKFGRRIVCGLVTSLFVMSSVSTHAQPGAVVVGSKAPNASLITVDGATVDLAQYFATGPVLLEFWATWCSTCEELEPTLKAAQARFAGKITMIGVAVASNQTPARVKAYARKHGLPATQLFDATGSARDAFGVPGTSYVVVINRAGTVVYIGIGANQNLDGAIRRALE